MQIFESMIFSGAQGGEQSEPPCLLYYMEICPEDKLILILQRKTRCLLQNKVGRYRFHISVVES